MTIERAPIKYSYDPDAAELRFMTKHIFGQWRSISELIGIFVMLLGIYFIVKIAIREYTGTFAAIHPRFAEMAPLIFWAGILLGLVAAYLCGLLVSQLHSSISDHEAELAAFRQGPIKVTLDRDGIHTVAPNTAQFLNWRSVRKVVKTPQGLGLRLDESHFIPVIDAELPDGITREDVMLAIEAWRGTSA